MLPTTKHTRRRQSANRPAVGDLVATISPIPHVGHLNGNRENLDLPRSTVGTVTGKVSRGDYLSVDFGVRGKLYVPATCVSLIDASDEVIDALGIEAGTVLTDVLFHQRGVIYDLQSQNDRQRTDLDTASKVLDEVIARLEKRAEDAEARATGLQDQLDGLTKELMDQHRAPNRLAAAKQSSADTLCSASDW